jgi:hypothetical protein
MNSIIFQLEYNHHNDLNKIYLLQQYTEYLNILQNVAFLLRAL